MAAELVNAGAVSFTEVFGLTVQQLESLYESRQRMLASNRHAFVNDLLVGIASLTESGQQAAQRFLDLVRDRSLGKHPDGMESGANPNDPNPL